MFSNLRDEVGEDVAPIMQRIAVREAIKSNSSVYSPDNVRNQLLNQLSPKGRIEYKNYIG